MTPDITIGIPTRNRRADLSKLLRRIDALDDSLTYQLIVIDEESTDDTPELLARWRPRQVALTVVRHDPPLGVAGARNRVTELAEAPYVAWIDDDDDTAPTRFAVQIAELRRTGYRWSACSRVDIDADDTVTGHAGSPQADGVPLQGEALQAGLLRQNIVPAASGGLVMETAFVRELGGFDESFRYVEDWDFIIRAALADPRVAWVDEPLVGYRIVHGTSMTSHTDRMIAGICAVFDKHAREAAARGVRMAAGELHASLLAQDLRISPAAGRRRALLMAKAEPTPAYIARAAAACLAPGAYRRYGDRVRDRGVPADWRAQAEAWLSAQPPELDFAARSCASRCSR